MVQLVLLGLLGANLLVNAPQGTAAPQKIIIDTDIGDDIDDAFALALAANDPGVQILGVTTTYGPTDKRAQIAAKLLNACGNGAPVHAGRITGTGPIGGQYKWAAGYQSDQISSQPAADFIDTEVKLYPGQVVIVGIGPLTNLADLLNQHPEDKSEIKRIVLMGGAVRVGYNDQPPPVPEHNIYSDIKSAQTVFNSGVPLTVAALDVTIMMKLDQARQDKIWAAGTPTSNALEELVLDWGHPTPVLYDPMALAYGTGHQFADSEQDHLIVDDQGFTKVTDGSANATVLTNARPDVFLDWCVQVLGAHPIIAK